MALELYHNDISVCAQKVRIVLAEKGLDIPIVQVDLRSGEHLGEAFRAINPRCSVPLLELDDGTCIGETVAIARYLEALHPDPPFFGRDALESARLEMWLRIVEFGFYSEARAWFRHTMSALAALEPVQIADWGELNQGRAEQSLRMLDGQLAGREYIAGPDFSFADIVVVTTLQAPFGAFPVPDDCKHVQRWYEAVAARPSVASTVPPRLG